MLSEERKNFILDYFSDNHEVDNLVLETLDSPEDLDFLVDIFNWDHGLEVLNWIITNDLCSEATALKVFWNAQVQDYQQYDLATEQIEYDNDVFQLIKTILFNYQNGFYKKTNIGYDPQKDMPTEMPIPAIMQIATQGEETYIYYKEYEVLSWFGEEIQHNINRCDTAIDLFNIASFTKKIKVAKLILEHPLCDKGIALMLYWRLKTFANIYVGTDTILNEIVSKIQNNEYPEVLAYDPNLDDQIELNSAKPKWEIPEIMKVKV